MCAVCVCIYIYMYIQDNISNLHINTDLPVFCIS